LAVVLTAGLRVSGLREPADDTLSAALLRAPRLCKGLLCICGASLSAAGAPAAAAAVAAAARDG
jgi:hypothetical protein